MPKQDLSDQEIDDLIVFLDWVANVDNQGWPPRPILVTGASVRPSDRAEQATDAPAIGATPVRSTSDPRAIGENLFRTVTPACAVCHSLQPGVQMAGPSLAGLAERAEDVLDSPDYTGAAGDVPGYIRESIIEPSAHLLPGAMFSANGVSFMPATYRDSLSDEQIDQLVAFLGSLR
jgi:nitric oxide reductase subunit C